MRGLTLLFVLFTGLSACTPARNAASGTGKLARAAAEGVSEASTDPSITFAIKSAMIEDDVVRARDIDVDTDDGVVTLTGTQPSVEARDRAEKLAWTARGVVKVVNRLTVRPAMRPSSEPAYPPPP
jgi:osmotically-inducible protein OsmY